MKHEEKHLSYQIAHYLRAKYPHIIYRFDIGADIRLTMGQAILIKNNLLHKKGYPDLFIAQPTLFYHGLYIELKNDKAAIYKKTGELRKNQHLKEQYAFQKRLCELGYYATFGCGFTETTEIIDKYISGKKLETKKEI